MREGEEKSTSRKGMSPQYVILLIGVFVLIALLWIAVPSKQMTQEQEEEGQEAPPVQEEVLLPQPDDPNFPLLAAVPPEQRGKGPDCYLFPGSCPQGMWCQYEDRPRWWTKEQSTRGRCVPYQKECYSCTSSVDDDLANPSDFPALNRSAFTSDGQYLVRPTVCEPGLVCTGDTIPVLPPTCVKARPRDRTHSVTRDEMIQWSLRFVRLGGRPSKGLNDRTCRLHNEKGVCERYVDDAVSPLTKGASQQNILVTANNILHVLWPSVLGPFPGPFIPGELDRNVPACDDPQYVASLTDYQKANGGPDYRAPIPANGKKNAPPCLWKNFDTAYNDEGPSIWSLIHTITANLPERLSDKQVEALRTIPMYLRMYLSCGTCRGHIKEHLIDIGIPTSNRRDDWFRYFWRAHNFVSEQTAHTRIGENTDGGLPWACDAQGCAGKYVYPWFMPLSEAYKQWRIQSN